MTPEVLFVVSTAGGEAAGWDASTPAQNYEGQALSEENITLRLFHTSLLQFQRETGNAHLLLMFSDAGMDDLSREPAV